jgi:dipeptidyl aminopeptidase/acylaminoacyl peptidase
MPVCKSLSHYNILFVKDFAMGRYGKMMAISNIARMCITLALFSFVILASCTNKKSVKFPEFSSILVQDSIPPIPDSIISATAKYHNTRSASLVGWFPDGNGMVIQTRFAETNQLHSVNKPGGVRYQKTFRSEEVIDATICPDPAKKLVVFSQDRGGNELFQLHALYTETMQSRMVTDGHSNNGGVVWSNRGDRFTFQSTKRNGKDWDIYICSVDSAFTISLLMEVEGLYSVLDWNPDDNRLLVRQYISSSVSRLYILDIAARSMIPLKLSNKDASIEEAFWNSDGSGVLYTSDENYDNRTLCYYDLQDQKETALTAGINWDIRYLDISPDRRKMVFTTNEHGYLGVYILDTKKLVYRKLDFLQEGIYGCFHFHPVKNVLGYVFQNAKHPGDVYEVDLDKNSITQWTFSEYGELDSVSLVMPELITYPSFDTVNNKARQIPAFYYKPSGKGPFPVLIFIHGGPETQFWPTFSPLVQYFVNELKIAVIAPNVRGSGGYGKSYQELDNGFHREDAVKDIGALIDRIVSQPDLDSLRVGVMGGSYGGYMVLASMVHYNKRLKAGIDLYGISNFITFLQNTASYRRDLRRVEYGDERDSSMRAYFEKIAPLNSAYKIKAPLLIIQGANDARVPASESEQIAEAVKKNGKTVWMLVAEDEGHGFRRKSNREYQNNVISMFIQRFLVSQQ